MIEKSSSRSARNSEGATRVIMGDRRSNASGTKRKGSQSMLKIVGAFAGGVALCAAAFAFFLPGYERVSSSSPGLKTIADLRKEAADLMEELAVSRATK